MQKRTTTEWMAAAFTVGLAIVAAVYVGAPHGEKLELALRATARWSFLLFWPASVGSALVALFGLRFQPVAHRARDFGLSYASAHLVHLALVAWLLYSSVKPFPRGSLVFFGIGVFWTYLLALLSNKHMFAMLGPKACRIARTIGIEYIAFAFLVDFAKNPFEGGISHLFAYLPFLTLAIAGPLMRLAALTKRLSQARRLATS
jgi:hypothetical protein